MYWNGNQLKQMARTALKGSYWKCVLAGFLLSLTLASFASGSFSESETVYEESDTIRNYLPVILSVVFVAGSLGMALRVFVLRPLEVGCRRFFMDDIYYPVELDCLKAGFSGNYWNVVWVMFCRDIFTFLWSCLLIIPGIVKSYEYKMIPYILAENPNLSRQEVFAISKRMMDGDKMNTFVLELSFIGWALLAMVTCGLVGVFYYQPYLALTEAALYHALTEKIGGHVDGAYNNEGYDNGSYDNGGYNNGGYDNGGYDNGGYDNSGYNNGGYDNGGYDNGGYNNGGYDNGGYDNGGYNNGGYNNGGYDNGGYNNGGYNNGGYDNGGYNNGGYDNGSYNNNGGYDNGGYNNNGYEDGGYDNSSVYNYNNEENNSMNDGSKR